MSLLANAVASGKADVVRLALRYPVDINAPARRGDAGILFWALQNAKPDEIGDVMTALINAGADVNATQGGEYNAPVVFSACSAPAAFKSLFAAGVDVNSRLGKGFNSASRAAGETLLMYCATTLPAVRQLLADGADPTLVSTNGFTALKAAQRDCDECAAVIETAIEKSATVGSVGAKRKP
jgi:ankyrin repeat protein